MKAIISCKLNMPGAQAWHTVKQSQTLLYVCRGLLSFDGSEGFPAQWQEGLILRTRLKLFGLIPGWQHTIYFSRLSDLALVLYTQEHGGVVQSWNHEIRIQPHTDDSCIYSDQVDIKAGLLTPLVWLFAHALYRYRQRRWQHLAKNLRPPETN